MTTFVERSLAILHEHPDWFRPLFKELDRRGLPWTKVHASDLRFDPSEPARHALVLNRMSPSAWLRGNSGSIFHTTQYLEYLEHQGVRVINGTEAWRTEISKARQLTLLQEAGLPAPKARVVSSAAAAVDAADGLRFPVVVKPNVGGSGAGVVRFERHDDLRVAAAAGTLDLGIDGTALVQEFIPAESGRIVRVEVLNGKFLYAIRIYMSGESFNLCPADVCRSTDGAELVRGACPTDAPGNDLRVEGYTPPQPVIEAVERITAASGIEIGGVEYIVDERDGALYYYDVNALSNFVADAERIVGFDPFVRLADWLEEELEQCPTPSASSGRRNGSTPSGASAASPAGAPTRSPGAATPAASAGSAPAARPATSTSSRGSVTSVRHDPSIISAGKGGF